VRDLQMEKINTICVIDDDHIYHFTLSKLVEKSKLFNELLSFTDGEQALSFFRKNAGNSDEWPDVILLDINMPMVDGWYFIEELTRMMTNSQKKILVYMVSSSVDSRDIDRARNVNILQDYIIKPVTLDVLKRIHSQYFEMVM
jgi:CheY-like chemotaxis protein